MQHYSVMTHPQLRASRKRIPLWGQGVAREHEKVSLKLH